MVSAVSLPSHIQYPHLKGKPHWKRTLAVYAALDNSPINATYDELIEWVGQMTGQKCSRKLISKWREERHLRQQDAAALIPQSPESSKVIPLEHDRPFVQPSQRRPGWLKRVATVGQLAQRSLV